MPSDLKPRRRRPISILKSVRQYRFVLIGFLIFAAWSYTSRPSGSFGNDANHEGNDGTTRKRWKGWETLENRGLIAVDVGEVMKRHPIEDLIEEARLKARRLKSSKPLTTKKAIAAYHQCWNYPPPKGFDKWFEYFLTENRAPDIIKAAHESFIPFLSIPGRVLRERLPFLDGQVETFSLEFKNGKIIESTGTWKDSKRANEIRELLGPVGHLIPDLKVYFNTDDMPRFIAHDRVWNATTHYGSKGELWPEAERQIFEHAEIQTFGFHWPCRRHSEGAFAGRDVVIKPKSQQIKQLIDAQPQKSFVYDQMKNMDYCENSDMMKQHQLLIYGSPKARGLIPILSTCRTLWSVDIPSAPLDAVKQKVALHPWSNKTIAKAMWRGQMTGMMNSKEVDWRSGQRVRLHHFANPKSPHATQSVILPTRNGKGWESRTVNHQEAAKKYFDIGLVGGPFQCIQEDGTCDEIREEINFYKRLESQRGETDSLNYQFNIDVDGNGWSSRFRRLLLTGSVTLKATIFPEWFSSILIPYYHYVPLQNDFSDLLDVMAFFTSPKGEHLAAEIGKNGRMFVEEHWDWKDMQSYMVLLLLEYSRVMSDDRSAMSLSH